MTPMSRLALAFVLLLAGCTVRTADLTLISTKNIDLSNAELDVRKGNRYEGRDCKFLTIPNLEEAMDEALEEGGGNVMVDQVTYQSLYLFVSCISVEGTVLDTSMRDQ